MRVRVPVLGTVGKSIPIDTDATNGATIGTNLFLPDGSVPTLDTLRALFAGEEAPTVANTIWKLIREVPANVQEVEALSTSGLVVRQVDGNWLTRSIAVEADGLLQISQPAGESGNPTLGAASIDALSIWGRAANTAGKPAPIIAAADTTLLRRSGSSVGFGTITSAYVSDFTEAAQDAVLNAIADSARIDFAYDDNANGFTADLIAGSVANMYLADMAEGTVKGRAAGAGPGVATDLSGAQVATIIGYTAADVLAKLLTIDGAGSLLDADLLDGLSSAAFLQTSTYEALTPTWSGLHTHTNNILLTSANPRLRIFETGLAADTGAYDLHVDGGTLQIRTRTDADGAGQAALTLTRPSGTQPLRLFTGGVEADLPGFSTTAGNVNNFTVVFSSFDITRNANFALVSTQRPLFNFLKYAGTFASPTQIQNNTALHSISLSCYNTDTTAIATSAAITTTSTETWGLTAQGTRMDLATTPNGSTSRTINLRLAESQIQLLDGTLAAPSRSYQNDSDTGSRRIGANNQALVCGATDIIDLSTVRVLCSVPVRKPTYTVAGLPAAGTVGAGSQANVSDSNSAAGTNLGGVVAGGGAVFRVVYSDGANWRLL